ncbi:MAG: DUF4325 domain-containing protein [Patescibacteria group bacterium]|jgi:hypothetical protein
MQTIYLKKFGTVLVSRPAGLEAFQAIRSSLDASQPVAIDFEGVLTVTPSWFDEFLTNLADYFSGKVELLPTQNASVRVMLPVLAMDRHDAAAQPLQKALITMKLKAADA